MERARAEAVAAPDEPAEDGHRPREVVARHGEREERVRRGVVDQAEQAEHHGGGRDAEDHPHRLVLDALADVAEEAGEGQRAVAREGPALARGGDHLDTVSDPFSEFFLLGQRNHFGYLNLPG